MHNSSNQPPKLQLDQCFGNVFVMNNTTLSNDNEIGPVPTGTVYPDRRHIHLVIWAISYGFLSCVSAIEQSANFPGSPPESNALFR